ncbi:hypothetical protein PC129_g16386 [Phytophthora cactorum]|uniref:Serine protease n=1 Tax=Phytophthora cactorum TaxID=29920 RepID=A0A329RQ29_9STRA|nr:hypothetical protein Pcac1_g12608 [Phytophthora cactorum]KAG2806396.1 hypothetical protein PC112_g17862 [Phytophthora cactorum]KAG2808061.1 hypothetical protein PC111_g16657 [Phytophthora cactorum]KAG2847300.1 hypothetical protein PC113_g17805 [Phytophthora cactorum]KAG2891904.1 hypothetical protein PC114_g16810 [Phytophthora cactorum]
MTRILLDILVSVVAFTTTWPSVTTAQEYHNSSSGAANRPAGVEAESFGVGCGGDMEYPPTDELSVQPRFAYLITNQLADFIAVHFKHFNLPENDYVQVRAADPASSEKQVLQFRGSESSGDFYCSALSTSAVIVELFTAIANFPQAVDASECLGFSVNSYQYLARGSSLNGSKEEVCGFDNSREASCYKSFTDAFQASKTVARLLTNKPEGAFYCTGWLLGSEGHLMTNHHCISSQTHADNTEFEFDAGGSVCSINCGSARACSGSIRAKSATLIYADEALDYALLKLPVDVPVEYGYLRLRTSGAVMSERVYMPQHPAGWGKRIAMKTDSGWGTVKSLTMGGCATDQVAYYLDTQGGSSGSPVLSWSDNTVIALHHCGGCPNTAINSYKLVNDMKWRNILPANATV